MKTALNILFLCLVTFGYSQGIYNNGAHIVIASGSHIYVDGDANGGYTNSSAGVINSDGTFTLEGDWINNGSTDVYTSIDNTGTTVFGGTTLQQIGGSHLTNFENLTMNNSGSGAYISQNEKIEYTLTITSGDFDLQDNDVQLVDATSSVSSETSAKRIKSTDGSGNDGAGTGTIYTIRDNPSGNVANFGLTLPSISGNNITIARGHLQQDATNTSTGNKSVFRYFKVSPVPNAAGGSDITFEQCYSQELNGHNSSHLIIYQLTSAGTWSYLTDNSANNEQSVPITRTLKGSSLDYVKVTLASSDTPLPIELKDFSVTCHDNGKLITWVTASETNNDYFTLQKSDDGINFYTIASIPGVGNSSMENTYDYFDNQSKGNVVYYRLSQTDFDGDEQLFNIISANCSNNNIIENFNIINNPANESVELQIIGHEGNQYVLSFIDQLGRQLIKKKIHLDNNQEKVIINTHSLSQGIYNIVMYSDKNIITKQLIINK